MKTRLAVTAGVVVLTVVLANAQDVTIPDAPKVTKGTDPPVAAALDWLSRHQSPDGLWHAADFSAQCQGAKCTGDATAGADVGTTALALLAFVGTGETSQSGAHRDTVKNAVKALRALQDTSGFVGPKSVKGSRLQSAYAAVALVEHYGMTGSRMGKEPARLAVTSVASSQDPSGGWKLADADAACDPALTGVCVVALRCGKLAELEVDAKAFDRAVAWLDAASRTAKPALDSRTAAALVTRAFAKWDAAELAKDKTFAADGDAFAARVPEWTDKSGVADLATWCVAAPALFQKGGGAWDRWWKAFYAAAKSRQRAADDGCARGSWDTADPHVPFGGRVATTAMLCRALEAPYVYGRLGEKAQPGEKK